MKKFLPLIFLLVLNSSLVYANTSPNLSSFFQGKSACFLLFNLTQKQWVTTYNPAQCAERVSPYSTFKVPLSLMAFDQHLITQNTVFKWNGQDKGRPDWNHDQTPQTWLKYSVVWVSQLLTPQLGLDKIKHYLQLFNYGNQDFSGGLTSAWLGSSLKISPDEQLKFMQELTTNSLPVSQKAMTDTKQNLYLETSPNGWKLSGKTGGSLNQGWFVGYVQKREQTYVFTLSFSDQGQSPANTPAGPRAEDLTKSILAQFNLF
jgi:beta-lactamase class D